MHLRKLRPRTYVLIAAFGLVLYTVPFVLAGFNYGESGIGWWSMLLARFVGFMVVVLAGRAAMMRRREIRAARSTAFDPDSTS